MNPIDALTRELRDLAARVAALEATSSARRTSQLAGEPARMWVRITAAAQPESRLRWVYTATRVIKSAAGYGGWTEPAGAPTVTCRNAIEDLNAASGIFGNGVNSSNLVGSFTVRPVPAGAIVEVVAVPVTPESGTPPPAEWWFSYENAIDGACPP